jgi:ADP-dependent NAD(P)H-hydrate dehydratase / NAD(P)H-hydrate epimerase
MLVSTFPEDQPVYLGQDIRAIELVAAKNPTATPLMERAGRSAAQLATELLGNKCAVLVLAGPGNNGGDALVAARHLKQLWFEVSVLLAGDSARLPPDAAAALLAWRDAGGTTLSEIPNEKHWDLIIDGLFGIGLARDLAGDYLALVKRVNGMNTPVLSLDIPSGLDSETGQPFRASIRASHTLTFIGLKPGLFTANGPDYCGQVHLDTLDLPEEYLPRCKGRLIGQAGVATFLKPRPRNSHKGMQGSVGVVGGANSMTGAALLAGRAALKLGAGLVYLSFLTEPAPGLDVLQPELMLRTPAELLAATGLDCMVVGPGLGQSAAALAILKQALESERKLVLDADALNLLAAHPELQTRLEQRKAPTIITPHPAEAGRLLGCGSHNIQQDRIGSALVLAGRLNSLVVLKGAGTICAHPDQSWHINPSGNSGLSSAGMGDILSGMLAALLAQGLPPTQAMLLAVYLHGVAADELVETGIGPIGLTASEVTEQARRILNRWVYMDTASISLSRPRTAA